LTHRSLQVANGTYQVLPGIRDTYMGYDAVTVEGSNSILGSWTTIGNISHLGITGSNAEGPILYKFNDINNWCLMVDKTRVGTFLWYPRTCLIWARISTWLLGVQSGRQPQTAWQHHKHHGCRTQRHSGSSAAACISRRSR
jgi:hypothetical protein